MAVHQDGFVLHPFETPEEVDAAWEWEKAENARRGIETTAEAEADYLELREIVRESNERYAAERQAKADAFVRFMTKAAGTLDGRDDQLVFCSVIDTAKERGVIKYEAWTALNRLASKEGD